VVFKRAQRMEQQVIAVTHLDCVHMEVIKRRGVKMPVIFSKFDQRQAL